MFCPVCREKLDIPDTLAPKVEATVTCRCKAVVSVHCDVEMARFVMTVEVRRKNKLWAGPSRPAGSTSKEG